MKNRDYLVVDRFLQTETDAQALRYALRSGLIDRLQLASCSFDDLPLRNPAARRLLIDLLETNEVVRVDHGDIELAPGFLTALAFRDLLEAKLKFGETIADDISHYFRDLIEDLPRFMAVSKTFGLFRYDRCFEATAANVEATRRWMELTTALTRYEGKVLVDEIEIPDPCRMLDIGGNSGELAIQMSSRHRDLDVVVFDLPVVCRIGAEHVRDRGYADRIKFQAGDMRGDPLPLGMDVVTLKSLLHDWPERDAVALLEKAAASLGPSGILVIFERAPIRLRRRLPWGQLANLVFFPFFREAELYIDTLGRLGFDRVDRRTIELETDFHLIVASRAP